MLFSLEMGVLAKPGQEVKTLGYLNLDSAEDMGSMIIGRAWGEGSLTPAEKFQS